MAEPLTMQDLVDGRLDVQTLKEAVNEDKMIASRLGKEYASLPMASRMVVENGLVGATPFSTYAKMTTGGLIDGDYAIVTNDPDVSKLGIYIKESGNYIKTRYNDYQDMLTASTLEYYDGISGDMSRLADDVNGYYIVTSPSDDRYGQLAANATSAIRAIPIIGGETYTVYADSVTGGRFYLGWSESNSIANAKQTTPANIIHTADANTKKVIAPPDANYLFVNTLLGFLSFDIRLSLWVNKGDELSKGVKKRVVAVDEKYFYDELAHEKINNLQSSFSPLKGKKWVVIGDSITAKTFRSNQNYHDFVAESVGGMTVYNYGISGSGYNDRHGVASTITETNIDLITIALGVNDYSKQTASEPILLGNFLDTGTTTISGCINTLITSLLAKYQTGAKMVIFTPLPTKGQYGYKEKPSSSYSYSFVELVDMIKKYAEHYSLPCLDLYRQSNLQPWLPSADALYFTAPNNTTPDGLHPNDAGHERISTKIKAFLESV